MSYVLNFKQVDMQIPLKLLDLGLISDRTRICLPLPVSTCGIQVYFEFGV